jgi:hypothetical protein
MTLSLEAKVQPNRSTFCSPAGFRCRLQFNVERSGADATPVHRTQGLDVADRVEAEPPGDSGLNQFNDTRHRRFGFVGLHEVEVALRAGWAEIGN